MHDSSSLPASTSSSTGSSVDKLCVHRSDRGMCALQQRNEPDACFRAAQLISSCRLVDASKSVIIAAGFVVLTHQTPYKGAPETDGPPGACFVAKALVDLGLSVVMLGDAASLGVARSILHRFDVLHLDKVQTVEWPIGIDDDATQSFASDVIASHSPALAISIEHPGTCSDGKLRDMKGNDITHVNAKIDALFHLMPANATIGIGDGGNELGFGSLAKHIPSADTNRLISAPCVTSCTHLVLGKTSNYACFGLLACLGVLMDKIDAFIPSAESNEIAVQCAVDNGAIDGVTKSADASVDGLSLADQSDWLRELIDHVNH